MMVRMEGSPFSNVIAPVLGMVAALGADQASKSWAMGRGATVDPPRWLRPVRCRHPRLDGPDAAPTLAGLAALLPALALWPPWPNAPAAAAAVGLAIGGAAGNLLDQRRLGGVRDFVDLGLGAFNGADVMIVAGTVAAAMLLIAGACAAA